MSEEDSSITDLAYIERMLRRIASNSQCEGFARLEALRVLHKIYVPENERKMAWPTTEPYSPRGK